MSTDGFIQFVIAVAALAGIVVWGLGGRSKQSTNEALVDENQSLRNQLGDAKAEVSSLTVRAEKSETNEEYLKELAQSKPDFSQLSKDNTNLSIQLTEQHKQILDSFSNLTTEITKLATTIAKDR